MPSYDITIQWEGRQGREYTEHRKGFDAQDPEDARSRVESALKRKFAPCRILTTLVQETRPAAAASEIKSPRDAVYT